MKFVSKEHYLRNGKKLFENQCQSHSYCFPLVLPREPENVLSLSEVFAEPDEFEANKDIHAVLEKLEGVNVVLYETFISHKQLNMWDELHVPIECVQSKEKI